MHSEEINKVTFTADFSQYRENNGKELIEEDDILFVERARKALKSELKRKQKLGLPIGKWDSDLNKAYMEYSDGRREYVD